MSICIAYARIQLLIILTLGLLCARGIASLQYVRMARCVCSPFHSCRSYVINPPIVIPSLAQTYRASHAIIRTPLWSLHISACCVWLLLHTLRPVHQCLSTFTCVCRCASICHGDSMDASRCPQPTWFVRPASLLPVVVHPALIYCACGTCASFLCFLCRVPNLMLGL